MLVSEYSTFAQIILCLCMLYTDVYLLLAILSNDITLRTAQSCFVLFLCVRFLLEGMYLKVLPKLDLVKGCNASSILEFKSKLVRYLLSLPWLA